MAKEMKCTDVGMDCDFVAQADTVEDLMGKVVAPAHEVHGVSEITPELQAKVAAAIHDA